MDLNLRQNVVVVTGATSNIGRAIALAFAAEGVRLLAVGRDQEAGAKVISLAREKGADAAIFIKADLLDRSSPDQILQAAEKLGPISVLVNNVGGNVATGLFVNSDPASWQADLDLNLTTVLGMSYTLLPGMIERRAGRIINIGSTAGLVGDYMLPLYSTAKAAVHGFTKVLAKEVGQHGITVNCVAPYGTMSDNPADFSTGSRFRPGSDFFKQLGKADPEDRSKMKRPGGVLPRTMAKPEEVAHAVLYLASESAAFVTGQVLQVEGGTLL